MRSVLSTHLLADEYKRRVKPPRRSLLHHHLKSGGRRWRNAPTGCGQCDSVSAWGRSEIGGSSAATSTATDDQDDDPKQQQSKRRPPPPSGNREHEDTGQHAEAEYAGSHCPDGARLGCGGSDRDHCGYGIRIGDISNYSRASRFRHRCGKSTSYVHLPCEAASGGHGYFGCS